MAQGLSAIDRNTIVESISNFFTFLTTYLFLPASAIRIPPSEGWPEECRNAFRKLGKSDEVVDLLSHLPYIDNDNWLGMHDTKPINYASSLSLRRINGDFESKRYLFEPPGRDLPPHVFSLTDGKLYGVWLLVDTQAGTVTEFSVLNGPTPQVSDDQRAARSTWRLYPTKPIREFFAACQVKIKEAELTK